LDVEGARDQVPHSWRRQWFKSYMCASALSPLTQLAVAKTHPLHTDTLGGLRLPLTLPYLRCYYAVTALTEVLP